MGQCRAARSRQIWPELRDDLAAIREVCSTVVPIDLDTHEMALRRAERYRLAMFEALMIASALLVGSSTLWSEDMQDGMVIDGKLRIANPFRAGD